MWGEGGEWALGKKGGRGRPERRAARHRAARKGGGPPGETPTHPLCNSCPLGTSAGCPRRRSTARPWLGRAGRQCWGAWPRCWQRAARCSSRAQCSRQRRCAPACRQRQCCWRSLAGRRAPAARRSRSTCRPWRWACTCPRGSPSTSRWRAARTCRAGRPLAWLSTQCTCSHWRKGRQWSCQSGLDSSSLGGRGSPRTLESRRRRRSWRGRGSA